MRDFLDWRHLSSPIPIVLGDHATIYATCIVTVFLRLPSSSACEHIVKLHDVLYVHIMGCNLLSVGKLSSSSYAINFTNGICQLVDKMSVVVASFKCQNGMYRLHCRVAEKIPKNIL